MPPIRQTDTEALFDLIRAWAARHYPCEPPEEVLIRLRGRPNPVCLPIPIMPQPGRGGEPGRSSHSPDFRSFVHRGTEYLFSPTQAAVVRALHEAAMGGAGDVGQETLLDAAGSETQRLRDLFRRGDGSMHPAWGTLIITRSRGTYRLDVEVGEEEGE